jgi:hypothetical protein
VEPLVRIICAMTLCALVGIAQAESLREPMVEQLVTVPFKPSGVFAMLEQQVGEVKKIQSEAIIPAISGKDKAYEIFLGAPISPNVQGSVMLNYTFFLKGADGSFAATPVKQAERSELVENGLSLEELEMEEKRLRNRSASVSEENSRLSDSLQDLRQRASQIAGVEDIVDIKMELARLQGFGEQASAESGRLRALLDYGRKYKDASDINRLRYELTLHLQEAAKKTAVADRLNSRRKQAAKSSLEQKLALVGETRGYDAQALAKELLKLRAQIKELEQRSVPAQSDDF